MEALGHNNRETNIFGRCFVTQTLEGQHKCARPCIVLTRQSVSKNTCNANVSLVNKWTLPVHRSHLALLYVTEREELEGGI